MKCLILDTYYPAFLEAFFREHTDLSQLPYDVVWQLLMEECFGTSDYYSTNLAKLGHEATEVIANSRFLQERWAQENGVTLRGRDSWEWTKRRKVVPWLKRVESREWFYDVLTAQVKEYRPDVLYVQDMNLIGADFLRAVKADVKLTVGQIACPITPGTDLSPYDLILSSFPHFVERFRNEGLQSEYFQLGFEPKLLQRLKRRERSRVVFSGGLSLDHADRIELLEKIARTQPLDIWGYGVELLAPDSPLRRAHRGEAWALDMYEVLYNADIALNHHINVAQNNANNMRLYEATGVGSLLLTDAKQNLNNIFEVDKEVVAYSSSEECVELIDHYLSHEDERAAIARAGQERTMREHTYGHRMEQLVEILGRYL